MAANRIRKAVWLVTGALPVLGDTVAWVEDAFPAVDPQLLPYDPRTREFDGVINLQPYRDDLSLVMPRLEALEGSGPDLPFEGATYATLQHLKEVVSAAIASYGALVPMLLTFAAADGSLRTRSKEPSGGVPGRYGLLCGGDIGERRRLRELLKVLDPIRDAVAHGERPTNEEIRRFLGSAAALPEGGADDPWLPQFWEKTDAVARRRSLDLLRKLYRAWLMVTIRVQDGQLAVDLTKAEVVELLRQAQKGDAPALAAITSRAHPFSQSAKNGAGK